MNKIYKLKKTNNKNYAYLVIATSYISPMDVLDEISEEIECDNCIVLFDMLLRTGLSSNRYVSIEYKNNDFDINSIKIADKDIDENIKKSVIEFLNNNIEYVNESIIPQALKFLIKEKKVDIT